MNILQVLPELKSGGVETGTLDLAKELVRHGHKAVVVSIGGRLVKDLIASGGIHYTLPVNEKNPLTVINMVRKIEEIIEKESIDIVHARSRVPAYSAFFAAYLSKRPFITTCHGYYSNHILSRIMGWGKLVIVSSNMIARHMINDFGVPLERIRLVPRGVDLGRFLYKPLEGGSGKREYTIGMIGRITPIKGHIYLIRAISKVSRFMPNIKVHIIGDAPLSKPQYKKELETLVTRLGLSKYIHFLSERSDIPSQLAKLDLLVMPSVGEEAFGRVIIEAQASGVCVIASKVGGIVDIIRDGESGILVSPRDWDGLANAIMKILKDDTLRQKISKAARINVEKNFTLTQMYEKTKKVYQEAISSCKIVVLKYSALGDIILSLPTLKTLKEKFPLSNIIMLTSNIGRELLNRYPYVNEFVIFRNKKGLSGIKEILDVASGLRRESVDMTVDLQNNRKSHAISFLSCAPRRIGYKSRKLDFFINDSISGARTTVPPIAHQFNLLKLLDIDSPPSQINLMLSEEEIGFAENILQDGWVGRAEALVGLNCGASARWQTKRWPANEFALLCDMLAQNKIRVVITGTKQDLPQAEKIVSLAKSKPMNIVGKTNIMQLAAIIERCKVFVSSDSAPIHIASFLNVPFVALFGSTDPKRHIEPSERSCIIYKRLKCSPCYKPRCSKMWCMKSITAEEVLSAVLDLLKTA